MFRLFERTDKRHTPKKEGKKSVLPAVKWDERTHDPFQKWQLVYPPLTASRGFVASGLSGSRSGAQPPRLWGTPAQQVHNSSTRGQTGGTYPGVQDTNGGVEGELSESAHTNNYNTDCCRCNLSLYGMLKIKSIPYMHKMINIHQKSLSKKGHHENDPQVLAKGFQPSHADTLQLLLFPIHKLTASFPSLMGSFANILFM